MTPVAWRETLLSPWPPHPIHPIFLTINAYEQARTGRGIQGGKKTAAGRLPCGRATPPNGRKAVWGVARPQGV
jgi:hypothetical protein